jgi:sec-independent protein translocase protein TatA
MLPMFGAPGLPEILVILLLVVVIFGARRLPELGAGLGKGIKNFKSGLTGADEIDVTPSKDQDKVADADSSSSSNSSS